MENNELFLSMEDESLSEIKLTRHNADIYSMSQQKKQETGVSPVETKAMCFEKPKAFRARTIVFTSYGKEVEEDPEQFLRFIHRNCNWVMGQKEKCPKTGRIHIQGMAYDKKINRWGFLKGHNTWKAPCISPLDSLAYVSKGPTKIDGPWEFGERPTWNINGQKLTNLELLQPGALVRLVEEERLPLKGFKKLQEDLNAFQLAKKSDLSRMDMDVNNLWIVGEPGVGKSYFVRQEYPELFLKPQNKWWDGYSGHKEVLMDDFDQSGKCLSHLLKIWADRYNLSGEVKGGTIKLTYDRLIVTSNYTIEQLWGGEGGDVILVKALERRFMECRMLERGKLEIFNNI
nr:MAG: replication associated protein [Cressdnaviricota sp.]